jgi:hypothetical protein
MNSPIDHGSPESSSSGSPPPEDSSPVIGGSNYISNFTSNIHTIGSFSGPSKRRLPQGASFAAASSSRDPKTRRRERERERERGEPGRAGHVVWDKESGGLGKKEPELLDQGLVEHLRKGALLFSFFSYFILACVFSIYNFFRDWRSIL